MARTYKRDGNGRFAGGGGSSGGGGGKRPAAKSVSRGVNRLTRDNAGKITSVGGEGATARGGRLKTAAGNKRAMQTAKVSGGRPAGTMKGKIKRDPGAAGKVGQRKAAASTPKPAKAVRIQPAAKPAQVSAAKPKELKAQDKKPLANRVFIRGNFRPQNVMANPAPDKTKYYKNQKNKNIAALEDIAKKAGANTQVVTKRKQKLAIAMASKAMNLVQLNKASDFYANPRQVMRAQRRMGQLSTTDPRGIAFHELGHLRQKKKSENIFTQREFSSPRNARLAGRVSQYAKTNANEFAAETYAGLKTGRKYDSQVMRAYREEMGLRPLSIKRQLKRKAKPPAAPKATAKPKTGQEIMKAEMQRDRARIGRAAANKTRNADVRNSAAPMSRASFAPRPSRKTLRSQNRADSALDFYANPTKALKTVNKRKPGFRLPREMR